MIPPEACFIVVAFSGLIACLAHPAPISSYWFMLRRSRQLHLVHCVLITKELPTMPAVHTSVCGCKPLPAHGFGAGVMRAMSLPVLLGDDFVWIYRRNRRPRRRYGCRCRDVGIAAVPCTRRRCCSNLVVRF